MKTMTATTGTATSIGGITYTPDENGQVEVQDEHVEQLLAHGFVAGKASEKPKAKHAVDAETLEDHRSDDLKPFQPGEPQKPSRRK